jgi:DNA polymerase I
MLVFRVISTRPGADEEVRPMNLEPAPPLPAVPDLEAGTSPATGEPEIVHLHAPEDLELVSLHLQESAATKIFLDCETTGLDPFQDKLVLMQILVGQKVFLIHLDNMGASDLGLVKTWLADPTLLKIGQNLKFDLKFLEQLIPGMVARNLFDTYIAETLLTAGISRRGDHSLQALTKKYTGMELDKNQQTSFQSGNLTQAQIDYAVQDVKVLEPIFQRQAKLLAQAGLVEVALLEFSIIPAIAQVELTGLLIDQDKLASMEQELERQLVVIEAQLHELVGDNSINYRSPAQVKRLFAGLGINLKSTGTEVLTKVHHPVARALVEHRKLSKLLSSFVKKLPGHIHPRTGRIHPDFYQTGTEAGRFTCEKPNVQQIPKEQEWRDFFMAPAGYQIITADYSQIELRIMAEYSQDPAFLDAYHQGQDLHNRTASEMFGVPPEQVTKEQRNVAKTINFGLYYGMSANGLAARLNIGGGQAKKFIDAYFRAYPRVKDTLQRLGMQAVRRHYSETLSGRKRYYPPADSFLAQKSLERKGRNTPIQGSCGDILKKAIQYLMEGLRPYDARIINLVHDEIVIEVVEYQAASVKEIVKAEMIRAGKDFLKTVPVEVDLTADKVWRK